jgi:hypothetical protein
MLKNDPPLGRPQRTVSQTINFAESNATTKEKLDTLTNEIADGRAETRAQQVALTGQLAILMGDTRGIERLTRIELTNLARTIATLNLPTNHKMMGIQPRYIDNNFYNNNSGLVNLYLFSSVQGDPNYNDGAGPLNYDTIVYNFAADPVDGLPPIKLSSMLAALSRTPNRLYLDLVARGMINRVQMRAAVATLRNGFASSKVAILPSNQ